MKGLLSLLVLVFALAGCAGPSPVDSDITYDPWGYAHLTQEAKDRITNGGIEKLKGYDLTDVKLRDEVKLNKEAIFQAKGGGCTQDFLYRSRTGQLLLIVGVKGDLLDTVSFQDKEELRRKAKEQLRCDLPAS